MSAHTPDALTTLFVIHHPGGYPKYVTRGCCQTNDPAVDGDDLLHKCDTLPGSSGAPIFNNNTRKVVGLHYSAVSLRKLNAGKRIASIAKQSLIIAKLVGAVSIPPKLASPAPSQTLRSQEAASVWQSTKDTKSVAVLEAFIREFGDSIYAALARQRIKELRQAADTRSKTSVDPKRLASALQQELKRVGCYAGAVDGVWGRGSRLALGKFVNSSKMAVPRDTPTDLALQAVKSRPSVVCLPVAEGARTTSTTKNKATLESGGSAKRSIDARQKATQEACRNGSIAACDRGCRLGSARACYAAKRMRARWR